jgi:pimeloyl-ACP methyl ester carboxylesterase
MRRLVAVALLAAGVAACGGGAKGGGDSAPAGRAARAPSTATTSVAGPAPRLTDAHRCPSARGYTCYRLAVPLDRTARVAGTLKLPVAATRNAGAPRGVLVFLTGGPGQPGVPFAPRVRRQFAALRRDYRFVVIDQRGTGGTALRCPALQRAMGTSDLTVPPRSAVTACATALADRRPFFSTADTVADLEALRGALGVPRLTLDGVSYGTFVAERYAIAHPAQVSRLVLDSVVPAASLDGLEVEGMRETARVVRSVCRDRHCQGDPAADLAAVVRRRHDGPELYDTIVAMSVGAPSYPGLLRALREARAGRPARLAAIVRSVRRAQRAPPGFLSQGLHAATLCSDMRPPWGRSQAPLAGRQAAVARAAAHTNPYPFDRATVTGNGWIQTCLNWPPVASAPASDGHLPAVPTLLLAGDRDLSTPLVWARRQAALTPRGRLMVFHAAGHGIQSRQRGGSGLRAAVTFLGG